MLFQKNKKRKRPSVFVCTLNKLLKLKFLKLVELSIGVVKGLAVKVEFYENKEKHDECQRNLS